MKTNVAAIGRVLRGGQKALSATFNSLNRGRPPKDETKIHVSARLLADVILYLKKLGGGSFTRGVERAVALLRSKK